MVQRIVILSAKAGFPLLATANFQKSMTAYISITKQLLT